MKNMVSEDELNSCRYQWYQIIQGFLKPHNNQLLRNSSKEFLEIHHFLAIFWNIGTQPKIVLKK